jgi:hypothetical protein
MHDDKRRRANKQKENNPEENFFINYFHILAVVKTLSFCEYDIPILLFCPVVFPTKKPGFAGFWVNL